MESRKRVSLAKTWEKRLEEEAGSRPSHTYLRKQFGLCSGEDKGNHLMYDVFYS